MRACRPLSCFLSAVLILSSVLVVTDPARPVEAGVLIEQTWGVRGLADSDINIDWHVRDLEHIGGRQYAAGRFTEVVAPDGSTRDQPFLAAFDRSTGAWISNFTPEFNGPVQTIAASADGTRLYVGGEFGTINGVVTGPIAAIDPATGTVIPGFGPSLGPAPSGRTLVLDIAVSGSLLYLGGDFGSVNGGGQPYLARVNAISGQNDGGFTPDLGGGPVMAIEPSRDGRVFVGGQFRTADDNGDHAYFVGLTGAGRLFEQEEFDQRIIFEAPIVFDIQEADDLVFIGSQSNLLTIVDQQTLSKVRTYGPDVANEDDPTWFKSSDFQALIRIDDTIIAGHHTRYTGEPGPFGNGHLDSATGDLIPTNSLSKFDINGDQDRSYLTLDIEGGVWAVDDAGGGCVWIGGNLRIDDRVDWNLGRVCDVATFGPYASATSFVQQQYLDFLGREADQAGIAFWTAQADNNTANAAPIISQFLSSPEFGTRRQIIRLYLGLFQRLPDEAGLDFWAAERRNGTSLARVAERFLNTAEFAELIGTVDDRAFAAQIYRNVLGREPDNGGLDFWEGRLKAGMSRATLLVSFTESPEFVGGTEAMVTVTTIYSGMLERQPDAGGLAFWTDRLDQGGSVEPLIAGFFGSAEYQERIAQLPTGAQN